ncbi:BlaI/MecI/CopY family transcriptional regulator [Undibacterium rugosum]|uniref:BlaI/MecI/CopY family transcriptional regulator n=1 Tax=Undibacterium rugosum TaxID=2762291 RepID=A0A923KZ49_9BURK|nr:BlaI/MecI/CopY family transcriptional regulator [Undibacterium rugosum]MBC3935495.1 BlaI/MecI/CopY family transcriptional regulator [Undibacterium rugosum]MBR7778895.1 BlaI/MecI/CopY family transcriptional regulator [Undibacterium rugosum]
MSAPISRTIPKPTAAELNLLKVLWQHGPLSAKQVHEIAQTDKPDLNYATVLRQLQIMHGKGILTRDESQRSHVYAPAQEADSLQTNLLKDLIQKVFAGSGKALVLAALRGGHVSAQERAEIEKILKEEK